MPWDRYTDVYAEVIRPLQSKSDQLLITIEIEAEGEIDENTINQQIRETLDQIRAEVERLDVNDADEGGT